MDFERVEDSIRNIITVSKYVVRESPPFPPLCLGLNLTHSYLYICITATLGTRSLDVVYLVYHTKTLRARKR